MPFPCKKAIPKRDHASTFSIFRVRKSFERNGAPFAGELTRSFSLPRPTHMFSAFRHQRHREDLVNDKKGSKRGVSNDIQPTRGPSEREKLYRKEEIEI